MAVKRNIMEDLVELGHNWTSLLCLDDHLGHNSESRPAHLLNKVARLFFAVSQDPDIELELNIL